MVTSENDLSLEPRVVVGVDGSEDSKDALRWAAHEARQRGCVVHAVIAWQVPPMGLIGSYVSPDLYAGAKRAAEATLAAALAAVVDDLSGVCVSSDVIEGVPTKVLEGVCRDADLLVLGSRGQGRVSRIILGSVSRHMTVHSPCPVVVVPQRRKVQRSPARLPEVAAKAGPSSHTSLIRTTLGGRTVQ